MEPGDGFEGDEPAAFRPPPPPDDRLWRHPSELGWVPVPRRSAPAWPGMVVSGVVGAVVTVALLATTGVFRADDTPRTSIVREAVQSASVRVAPDGADLAELVAAVRPAVVRLDVTGDEHSVGSGVLIRDDGHLLTNAHVVDEAESVVAVLATGDARRARVVGTDADTDLALLKLDGEGPFPTVVLGTTDGLAVGHPAIAIGSPLGLSGTPSVTVGVVSGLGRDIESPAGPVLHDMVQTDAAIAAGSSGGALLDGSGALIGITTAFAVTDVGNGGMGFAMPVDIARAVAEDLIEVGRVRRVWFGVRGSDVEGGGVLVSEIRPGSPAARVGLRPGDVVRAVGGRRVATMVALRATLLRRHPGDRVPVVFEREGERRSVDVVLAERPH